MSRPPRKPLSATGVTSLLRSAVPSSPRVQPAGLSHEASGDFFLLVELGPGQEEIGGRQAALLGTMCVFRPTHSIEATRRSPLNIYGLTASSMNNASHTVTSTRHAGLAGKEREQNPPPTPWRSLNPERTDGVPHASFGSPYRG